MGLLDLKKAARRKRILKAARQLFGKHGYAATSMKDIADGADVAVGTLYGYFRDKVAIAEAISAGDLAVVSERAFATLPDVGVKGRLLHVFKEFYAHHATDMDFMRVVVKELSLADDLDSGGREQRFMALFVSLSEIIAEAQAAGEITDQFTPLDIAVNAFALYYFYLVGWLAGQPGFDPPLAHLERALGILFHGL